MPHRPRMMPITNTTQCEALGGSCSAQADCDVASNMFNGSCDDADMGCCISKDVICAAMKGECLSAADCDAKPDCHATPLECGDGVCCVLRRPPPQQRFGRKDDGNQRGENKRGRNGPEGQDSDQRELKHTTSIMFFMIVYVYYQILMIHYYKLFLASPHKDMHINIKTHMRNNANT